PSPGRRGPVALRRGPGVERGGVPAPGRRGLRRRGDLPGDLSPGDLRTGPRGGEETALRVAAARAGARGPGRSAPAGDRRAVGPARGLAVRSHRHGRPRQIPGEALLAFPGKRERPPPPTVSRGLRADGPDRERRAGPAGVRVPVVAG